VLGHPTTIGPVWALTAVAAYPVIIGAVRRRGPVERVQRSLAWILTVYAVCVVAVTVFPVRVRMASWQWAPWWIVIHYVPFRVPPVGFVLNIAMFVPLGILVPLLWPRFSTFPRMFLLALAASTAIELTQFVLWLTLGNYRTVDINDLISNTAGGVLGLLALRLWNRWTRADQDAAAQARM
jgi:glycopeptide antibiotics resistance protein